MVADCQSKGKRLDTTSASVRTWTPKKFSASRSLKNIFLDNHLFVGSVICGGWLVCNTELVGREFVKNVSTAAGDDALCDGGTICFAVESFSATKS